MLGIADIRCLGAKNLFPAPMTVRKVATNAVACVFVVRFNVRIRISHCSIYARGAVWSYLLVLNFNLNFLVMGFFKDRHQM